MVVLVIEMQLPGVSGIAVGFVGLRRMRVMVVRVRILMVAEMLCGLVLAVRAIVHGRGRRPGDLKRQQREQKQDQPATHGGSLSRRDFGNKQNLDTESQHSRFSVAVAMMRIGEMRVLVRLCRVTMAVRVADARRDRHLVGVLVVKIVHMRVFVLQYFVCVFMTVFFGEVQPHTQRHQHTGE